MSSKKKKSVIWAAINQTGENGTSYVDIPK
jgi:hypothetical protein